LKNSGYEKGKQGEDVSGVDTGAFPFYRFKKSLSFGGKSMI
jgi:hypothetical protein